MPKYFSGRVKRTPQGSLTTDRYQYIGLDQTEPNQKHRQKPTIYSQNTSIQSQNQSI